MTKKISSLYMDEIVWDRLDEQAKIMKQTRSELCEKLFAEAFGLVEILYPKSTIKLPEQEKVKK